MTFLLLKTFLNPAIPSPLSASSTHNASDGEAFDAADDVT